MLLAVSILKFLKTTPDLLTEELTKMFGERKVLLVQKLIEELTPLQVDELADEYWATKKEYTESMIDIFVNPDKPEYLIDRKGKKMRMLDYFRERIADGTVLM